MKFSKNEINLIIELKVFKLFFMNPPFNSLLFEGGLEGIKEMNIKKILLSVLFWTDMNL